MTMATPPSIMDQFPIIPVFSRRRRASTRPMNPNPHNTSPYDTQIDFGTILEESIDNSFSPMCVPETTTMQPQLHLRQGRQQLSKSLTLPARGASLIDNSFAQACSLKRSRCQQDMPSHTIKKSKSDNSLCPVNTGSNNTNGIRKIVSTGTSPSSSSSDLRKNLNVEDMCPYTYIESVLIGDTSEVPRKTQALHESDFLRPTEEEIAAYSNDAIAAVRSSDVNALREIYDKGQTLRCCNRFGESLLHVACRRSNADVVSFLLKEADVSPRIKDDYGRTPLHDACWRGNPEYEIVELLLSVEPKLAFVQDVRGHRPFQYARREHWGAWREFLGERRDMVLANERDGKCLRTQSCVI